MVEVKIDYKGELHCEVLHGPSQAQLVTDAPVDNQGRGESFSPTDLVATALGSCMATIMGIVAQRKKVDLTGMRLRVQKEMSTELPRRITCLTVEVEMPIAGEHPAAQEFVAGAMGCPVFESIHPDIEVPIHWKWAQ